MRFFGGKMGRWVGVGGLLLAALFWGGMIPLNKYQLVRWDPYFLVAARSLGAAPFLWLLMIWTERARPPAAPVARWKQWTFGIVGNGGFAVFYTVGVKFSDPVMAAILTAAGPAVAAVTDRFFFNVPLNRLMIPGLIASAIGCALASIDPGAGPSGVNFGGGEVLILLSMICWSWYSTVAQRWCPGWSQVRITFVTMVTSGVAMTALYLILAAVGPAHFPPAWPEVPIEAFSLLWYIVTVMVLGVVLWNAGVRAVGVVTASLYINLTPVVAITILVLLQGAEPTSQQLFGGALVLLGIVYSEWRILRGARPA
jgi:drug/metabolite transporter (DMT)-like permease